MKNIVNIIKYRNQKFVTISFTLLMVLGLTIVSFIYTVQRDSYLNDLSLRVENDLYAYAQDFQTQISDASSDIYLIEQIVLTRESFIITDDSVSFINEHEKNRIQVAFLDWLSVEKVYDQIRIIDLFGQEMVRANYNNGNPEIVSEENLQDKSGRYYFDNSIILNDNQLYISKLDLNVENGEIELVNGETKPMLRFSKPLYNDDNEKIGILVVNYLEV